MPFQLPELPYAKDALAPHMSARDARVPPGQAPQGLCHQDQRADARIGEPVGRVADRGHPRARKARATPSCSTTARSCGTTASSGNASRRPRARQPDGKLEQLISDGFGGTEALLQKLQEEAVNHFASGWAWLVLDREQAADHLAARRRHAGRRTRDGSAVHARCVGACLLHRLSQRAAEVRDRACCRTSSIGTSSRRTSTGDGFERADQEGARTPELTA